MAKNKFRITENDFLLANRKASREEEIAKYGKQILFRTTKQKSKKVYDRKRLKKAGIKLTDDLPFLYLKSTQSLRCRSLSDHYSSLPDIRQCSLSTPDPCV